MSITSDEVNYLVYRYLKESGFSHAAYSLQHEAGFVGTGLNGNTVNPFGPYEKDVPAGALITFLHKGLEYTQIATHLEKDGRVRPCSAHFPLVGRHVCSNHLENGGPGQGSTGRPLEGDESESTYHSNKRARNGVRESLGGTSEV